MGRVEIFDLSDMQRPLDGGFNSVQYEGFDALARLMAGDVSGRINAMYFQFDYNGPGVSRSPVGAEYTSEQFRNLVGDLDFLRVQLAGGSLSSTDTPYASNRATFVGVAALGDVGEANEHVFVAGSAIELVALVIAPVWSDPSQDLVYAAYAPSSPIIAPAAGGVAMRYHIWFEEP